MIESLPAGTNARSHTPTDGRGWCADPTTASMGSRMLRRPGACDRRGGLRLLVAAAPHSCIDTEPTCDRRLCRAGRCHADNRHDHCRNRACRTRHDSRRRKTQSDALAQHASRGLEQRSGAAAVPRARQHVRTTSTHPAKSPSVGCDARARLGPCAPADAHSGVPADGGILGRVTTTLAVGIVLRLALSQTRLQQSSCPSPGSIIEASSSIGTEAGTLDLPERPTLPESECGNCTSVGSST